MKYTLLFSSLALVASATQAIPNPIKTIHIKQGDSYVLELKANPNGYEFGHWKRDYTDQDFNQNVVNVQGLASKNGSASWKITGINKGSAPVSFSYGYTLQHSFDDWDWITLETRMFNFIVE